MRGTWTRPRAAAIAVGGTCGAALRWAITTNVGTDGFPWSVFAINAAGSLLLGFLLAREWAHPRRRLLLHDAGAIGFCGGFTTFSTFSVEVVEMVRGGDGVAAGLYVCASVGVALAGVAIGPAALHRLRAVTIPLEEEP